MKLPEPTGQRLLVTDSEMERLFAPQGVQAWHPGQVVLIWVAASLLIATGASLEAGGIVALGLLALAGAVVASWNWFAGRRPHTARGVFLTDPREIEVVECLAWAAVTAIRRLHVENAKTLTVDGRSLPTERLAFEGYALCAAAVKYAGDIVLRHDERLRHDLTRGFVMRTSFLLFGYSSNVYVPRVMERINQYGIVLRDDNVEEYGNRVWDLWCELFPDNDVVPGGIGSLVFTRFFKYVASDIYATVLTVRPGDAIRVTGTTSRSP